MSFDVIATEPFERKLKQLAKKYVSLPKDLASFIDDLADNPQMGTSIGKNCYKIRIVISSKGQGKRSGAIVITYVRITKKRIFLLDIYDKSENINILDKELKLLIQLLGSE
ncbi:MAG: addiction module toxin RelE [Saprospiraceae bacterium]